jgi:hypothetical protein
MKEKYTREFYEEFENDIIGITKEKVSDLLKEALDDPALEKDLENEFGLQFFKNKLLLKAVNAVLISFSLREEFDVEFIARMPTDILISFLTDFLRDVGDEILSVCEEREKR